MNNDPGSYIEKSYFPNPSSIVTCLMMGALCAPVLAGTIDDFNGYSLGNSGSNFQGKMYQISTSTWSPIDQAKHLKANPIIATDINVTESLNVIRNLAFLIVDEDINNEIEQYFFSKPIKTKTILVNSRIQQG